MSELPQPGDFMAGIEKKRKYPEYDICVSFWKRLQEYTRLRLFKKNFVIFHVPNEHQGRNSGWRLKQIGRLAGVLDYCVFAEGFMGFIEVKAGKTKLTDEQKVFIEMLGSMDIPHAVIRSADEGMDVLKEWMGSNEKT